MKVGVQLPEVEREVRWPELLAIARAAEAGGFDSIWVGDHMLYRDDGRAERTDEREREALQVVTRARHGEVDVLLRQPDVAECLLDDREQHLDLVAGRLARRLERRPADDRYVAPHHT